MPCFQAHESAPPYSPSVGKPLFVTCYVSELPVPPSSSPLVGESNVRLPTQTAASHAPCHPQGCTHTLVTISDDKARQRTCLCRRHLCSLLTSLVQNFQVSAISPTCDLA